jgi:hypothetical protein
MLFYKEKIRFKVFGELIKFHLLLKCRFVYFDLNLFSNAFGFCLATTKSTQTTVASTTVTSTTSRPATTTTSRPTTTTQATSNFLVL